MRQDPISAYALIGDTRSAALCSTSGSIDWLCAPRFDSDFLFAALIGGDEGGRFLLAPSSSREVSRRRYIPGTNVLETTWTTDSGKVVLTDAMIANLSGSLLPEQLLIRQVRAEGGSAKLQFLFDPKLGGRNPPKRIERRNGHLICHWGSLVVAITSEIDIDAGPGVPREFELAAGGEATFLLSVNDRSPIVFVAPQGARPLIENEIAWWQKWSSEIDYEGSCLEHVVRSLITLKLLTFAPSGAGVAAPTTSLPECIGGERNWDYRFAWPRDASIGIEAFLDSGKWLEAKAFLRWLLHATRLTRPQMDVAYTIFGNRVPQERLVSDLQGYRGSKPVRIGNSAVLQRQLDVYGWVTESVAQFHRRGHHVSGEMRRGVASAADYISRHWNEPDNGIWEFRTEPINHVHSKMMMWLALTRSLQLAADFKQFQRRSNAWSRAREKLSESIRSQGYDENKRAYVRAFGSTDLDASILFPLAAFEDGSSPRFESTIAAIHTELSAGGPLLYRYRSHDGLAGGEGAFLACSFWLVSALARGGRTEEATELLEELCGLANDVGLLSEEIDPSSGEMLGNFPQALSHAALVHAAQSIRAQH